MNSRTSSPTSDISLMNVENRLCALESFALGLCDTINKKDLIIEKLSSLMNVKIQEVLHISNKLSDCQANLIAYKKDMDSMTAVLLEYNIMKKTKEEEYEKRLKKMEEDLRFLSFQNSLIEEIL